MTQHNNYIYFHHSIHPFFATAHSETRYYDEYDIKRAINRGMLKVVSKEQLAKQQAIDLHEKKDPPRRDFYRLNPIILSYGWNQKKDHSDKPNDKAADLHTDGVRSKSKDHLTTDDKEKQLNVVIQNSRYPLLRHPQPAAAPVPVPAPLRLSSLPTDVPGIRRPSHGNAPQRPARPHLPRIQPSNCTNRSRYDSTTSRSTQADKTIRQKQKTSSRRRGGHGITRRRR